ncbi:hypothetical protein OPFLODJI_01329 [Aeromonas hydrophila]|uniref:abortive infection system antitoxin AbiGi family protein n=1 Tax=Aeromonas TaxID=642 RepID=UPI000B0E0E94|nr:MULTISPECIES: abortive infection system antitoxin AbiGi family protein [Aeromonas]ELM3719641.1 hypothetical protein [Aeromonas hydrophila]GKR06955.1 hypothetical protein KAM463_25200 [Aeromonas caviae]
MAISTNSIIHYTGSYKALTSILEEGFKVKYCLEKLYLHDEVSNAAHPMVSFCDIPLSDSTQHFSAYGKYGIGLSKEWAIKNGVNPVIYIDRNSLFAKSIEGLIKERRRDDSNLTEQQKGEILRIKSYAKNYSGELTRKNVKKNDYKFYDEREWRLVPGAEDLNNTSFSISASYYKRDKDKQNEKLANIRISFDAQDISYIIVKDTSQILSMVNFLRTTYSSRCTADELDILLTKICSTEQIMQDY